MRQSRQNHRTIPANDNVELGAKGRSAHVYVPEAHAKACSPHMGHIPKNGAGKLWAPTLITTNLPEILPILPEEIALIGGTMADLVRRILANDNEPI
jgi:hypothetical protein